MKIVPNQVFLDDYDRYEPDQEYEVPLEKGLYFVKNGWADAAEALPDENEADVTLDIHNSTIGVKDSNG
jgi:hypothetical protein